MTAGLLATPASPQPSASHLHKSSGRQFHLISDANRSPAGGGGKRAQRDLCPFPQMGSFLLVLNFWSDENKQFDQKNLKGFLVFF